MTGTEFAEVASLLRVNGWAEAAPNDRCEREDRAIVAQMRPCHACGGTMRYRPFTWYDPVAARLTSHYRWFAACALCGQAQEA